MSPCARHPGRSTRGQAITEFALVLPVMIVILLYSMYFTELVRAKLKLQEASRYVAWEMTSYALDDYAQAKHDLAFSTAQKAAVIDALDKFVDLESIDNRTAGGFVVGYSNLKATITEQDAPAFANPLAPFAANNEFIENLLDILNGSMRGAYQHFKFNTKGKLQVEVSMQLDNRLLPRHFLDENGGFFQVDMFGGRNLQNLTLKNRFTLLASGWALPDGGDAVQHQSEAGGPRSGVHHFGGDQGIYTQVQRMRLLGAPKKLAKIPGFKKFMELVGSLMPNPLIGTYVVSHNYFAADDKNLTKKLRDRGCDNDEKHGAHWGENNLDNDGESDGPGLDYYRRKCFDTAPFRDTSAYKDSHYRQIYRARGRYFMGCQNDQADNPAVGGVPDNSDKDKHKKKYTCQLE